MKRGREYIESLRDLKRVIYYQGEKIINIIDHPAFLPHINAVATTYDLAYNPIYEDLLTAISPIIGKRINRFTHIAQSVDDLVKQVKMLRALGKYTGTCFQRCVGMDALNAVYSVTYEIDQHKGTEYHPRFIEFLKHIQYNDLMVDGAMTDPKGDRSLPPSKQADLDLYLHIVEKRNDGLIVRGAKAHQTGAVNSHEILVMPTVRMGPEDTDYAISFAIPSDAKGIFYIFGRQTNDMRKETCEIDQGNAQYGVVGGEALIIFDNVFVPWERVFMCGEYEFTGLLVERFATYHRHKYGGCKVGVADVLIGATALVAEYLGIDKAAHVRDKITEMIHLTETLYAGSIASSYEGYRLPSGQFYPNPLLANITKLNVTRFMYEISRLAHDITGGILATLPSERDLKHAEIGKYIEKYFKGVANIPTENRFRITRLIENMTSPTALAEAMHGAGSPQAQRITILRLANLEEKKKLAAKLAGIKEVK